MLNSGILELVSMQVIVVAFVDELFPGMEVMGVHPFRVTRNADVRHNEEEAMLRLPRR